jgi:hypothetical protein
MLMSSARNHVGLERTFGKHPAAIGVVSVSPPRMQLRYRGIGKLSISASSVIGNPLHIEQFGARNSYGTIWTARLLGRGI